MARFKKRKPPSENLQDQNPQGMSIPTPPVGDASGDVKALILLTWPTGETFTIAGPVASFRVNSDKEWRCDGVSMNAPARFFFGLKFDRRLFEQQERSAKNIAECEFFQDLDDGP